VFSKVAVPVSSHISPAAPVSPPAQSSQSGPSEAGAPASDVQDPVPPHVTPPLSSMAALPPVSPHAPAKEKRDPKLQDAVDPVPGKLNEFVPLRVAV